MLLPNSLLNIKNGLASTLSVKFSSVSPPLVARGDQSGTPVGGTDPGSELRTQWANPADVSTVLLMIGGDVVQKAFAQGTGKLYTPVCFSFGCVAYAFIAMADLIGDAPGHLLPKPDYPVRVFDLESGYAIENDSFVLCRIARDIEAVLEKKDNYEVTGFRIVVYEATPRPGPSPEYSSSFPWTWIHLWGFAITVVQLVIAAGPIIIDRDWTVMFITAAATLLIQLTGWLPQWRIEKLPARQQSKARIALTTGNGSMSVVVILGNGNALDLMQMANAPSPRRQRSWRNFEFLSTFQRTGLPLGFRITQVVSFVLSLAWFFLLLNVSAPKNYSWFLLAIGGIGMFQNAVLAALEQRPEMRNLPLKHVETIRTRKVMDGLMDLEVSHGGGRFLLKEFFPGLLRPAEEDWRRGDRQEYDAERMRFSDRGAPRSH